MGALDPRSRLLLKQRFVDGMPLEALAKLHAVDRASVVRWVAQARSRVRTLVVERLRAQLALDEDELLATIRLIRSRLELSLRNVLASRDG